VPSSSSTPAMILPASSAIVRLAKEAAAAGRKGIGTPTQGIGTPTQASIRPVAPAVQKPKFLFKRILPRMSVPPSILQRPPKIHPNSTPMMYSKSGQVTYSTGIRPTLPIVVASQGWSGNGNGNSVTTSIEVANQPKV